MWEKYKTGFLAFLIFLSLVFSYYLWFGTPDYEAITLPIYEREPLGEPSSVVNLLLPKKIAFFPEQLSPDPSGIEEIPAREDTGEEESSEPGETGAGIPGEEAEEVGETEAGVPEEETEEAVQGEDPGAGAPAEEEPGEQENHGDENQGNGSADREPESEEEVNETSHPPRRSYIFTPFQEKYRLLWDSFIQQLSRVQSVTLKLVDQEEIITGLEEGSDPYLEIAFNAPFDAELFFPAQISFTGVQEFPLIQTFYLVYGEQPLVFCKDSQGNFFQVNWNITVFPLFNQLKELSEQEEPDHTLLSDLIVEAPFSLKGQMVFEEVFVWDTVPALSDFYFSRDLDAELVAKKFFLDLSLVRQIKERDEAIIFTDGQKGLRISSQGMVEYTAPLQRAAGKRLSYREALEIGAEYVSLYVELPDEVQLKINELKPVFIDNKEYYQMRMKGYCGGLALDPEVFTVELVYDRQGLVSYTCQTYQLSPGLESLLEVDAAAALSRVHTTLPEFFQKENPRRVSGIHLLYRPATKSGEESLQPFWNIEIDDRYTVKVNARSGEVLPLQEFR